MFIKTITKDSRKIKRIRNYVSKSLFQNTLILRRSGVVVFADIIKIVTMFIKTITKDSKKVKRIRNYVSKSNLYVYSLM